MLYVYVVNCYKYNLFIQPILRVFFKLIINFWVGENESYLEEYDLA